jgi:hypothetical protein
LHPKGRNGSPVGSHLVDIYRRRDDFHVLQAKLRGLGQDAPVARNNGPTIKVETTAIAASLIGVEINTPTLAGCRHDEFQPLIELAQGMIGTTAVPNDLNALQG